MDGVSALSERRATADDVLKYLAADYRMRAGLDLEVDPGFELTAETTIAQWRATCDLISVGRLLPHMNEWFGMDRPKREWRAVMLPERTRTLGELAAFVASHARWPQFHPISVGGVRDDASGAFFALRRMLVAEGVSVRDLRPSTPIDTRFVVALGNALARLAPGLVPAPSITHSVRGRIGGLLAFAGVVSVGSVAATLSWRLLLLGLLALLVGWLLQRSSEKLRFGEFRTLGDVARAMAAR